MGRALKASDKRKPGIMAAMKKIGKGTKVTMVEEIRPGVFQGSVLGGWNGKCFTAWDKVTVKEDGNGGYIETTD